MSRDLDLITIGRSSADYCGAQIGRRLEDMRPFDKYVGGSTDTIEALRAVWSVSGATLVCKRGPMGGAIPNSLDDGETGPALAIETFNVLGVGDWHSGKIDDAAAVSRMAARYAALCQAWDRARTGAKEPIA